MDKCCMTCKWLTNGKCTNKDLSKMLEISLNSEMLYERIEQTSTAKTIITQVLKEVKSQHLHNRNRPLLKIFQRDKSKKEINDTIIGNLDDIIQDLFTESVQDIPIKEIREFSCCYWE